jgi:hypothetical protein
MIRKTETIIGLVGGVLSLLVFGGFSATILSTELQTFEETLYPLLPDVETFGSVDESYELISQFSAWLGIFLFLMAISLVLATVLIMRNGRPKTAGFFYCLSSVFLFIGTQGIGFVFAFLFLVSAYLSFVKKIPENDLSV